MGNMDELIKENEWKKMTLSVAILINPKCKPCAMHPESEPKPVVKVLQLQLPNPIKSQKQVKS